MFKTIGDDVFPKNFLYLLQSSKKKIDLAGKRARGKCLGSIYVTTTPLSRNLSFLHDEAKSYFCLYDQKRN